METMELCVMACEKFSNNNEVLQASPSWGMRPAPEHPLSAAPVSMGSLGGVSPPDREQSCRVWSVVHDPGPPQGGSVSLST